MFSVGCSNLISVVIPDRVSGLGTGAFADCISLKTVEMLSEFHDGRDAFKGCVNLTDVYAYECNDGFVGSSTWNRALKAHIHYKECQHTITKNIETGLQIEEISNNLKSKKIKCGETYQFRVINSKGEIITNKKVKLTSQGDFRNSSEVTEVIYPNED